MKTRSNIMKGALLSGLIGLFLLCPLSGAYASIARVTAFTGDVVILSGANTIKLSKLGQAVNTGDKIQTKQGTAQLAFTDGAVLKINPHTTTMVQERMEERGAWMFKSKKMARRITVFVGKLWFKSGVSDRSNYLQSPTAVCGLRGSDGDFGYDNLNTYINMYSGEASITGRVLQQFFQDPGVTAAQRNEVYQKLSQAYEQTRSAEATGQALNINEARLASLDVVKTAATVLSQNPDANVKNDAALATNVANANIAATAAAVNLEKNKNVASEAQAAAQTAPPELSAMAQAAAKSAADELAAAQKQVEAAAAAAAKVNQAANDATKTSAALLAQTSKSSSEAQAASSAANAAISAAKAQRDKAAATGLSEEAFKDADRAAAAAARAAEQAAAAAARAEAAATAAAAAAAAEQAARDAARAEAEAAAAEEAAEDLGVTTTIAAPEPTTVEPTTEEPATEEPAAEGPTTIPTTIQTTTSTSTTSTVEAASPSGT